MRQELEQILSLITEKVSLRTGAVRRSVALTAVTQAQVDSAGWLSKKNKKKNNVPSLGQAVLCGGGDRVLGHRAGDGPLLRCCGNREVQETSICGAAALKGNGEVLLRKGPACARADVRTCFGRSEDGNRKERTKLLFSPFDFDFPSRLLDNIQGREN